MKIEVEKEVDKKKEVNEVDEKVEVVGLSSHSGEDYEFLSKAVRAYAKANDNLDQMIACMLDSSSKVDKVWNL